MGFEFHSVQRRYIKFEAARDKSKRAVCCNLVSDDSHICRLKMSTKYNNSLSRQDSTEQGTNTVFVDKMQLNKKTTLFFIDRRAILLIRDHTPHVTCFKQQDFGVRNEKKVIWQSNLTLYYPESIKIRD
jgi:hypothetical protein